MASWTSVLTGFMSGVAGAATNYPPAPDTTFSSSGSVNSVATTTFQQPAVAFGVPAGIEHIITPHIHVNIPETPMNQLSRIS